MPERHEIHDASRLIAKVLRDVLATEPSSTYADLVDALKCRLAQLRIRWTPDDLAAALRMVESNRSLLVPPPPPASLPPPPPAPISRREAPQVSASIQQHTGLQLPVRQMPRVPRLTQAQADREKALRIVLDELQACAARCDALEREPS